MKPVVQYCSRCEELLEALKEAVKAINEEVAADGDDEKHPIVVEHSKVADRCQKLIAKVRCPHCEGSGDNIPTGENGTNPQCLACNGTGLSGGVL